MDKPFSQACENNKQPILDVIRHYFNDGLILEIGSGTGQHAVFFGQHLPNITWQTSDRITYHQGILAWLADQPNDDVLAPLALDVDHEPWPINNADGIFSANTAHIMHWPSVENMFRGVGKTLRADGYFCLYGPVNIQGQYTSPSNESFDQHLKLGDPGMGIRNLEALIELAGQHGFTLAELHQMPANNVIMAWHKEILT